MQMQMFIQYCVWKKKAFLVCIMHLLNQYILEFLNILEYLYSLFYQRKPPCIFLNMNGKLYFQICKYSNIE